MIAPSDIALDAFRLGIRPPERLNLTEWARRHVVIPHSARSTRFDPSTAPTLNEPLNQIPNNQIKEIYIIAPVGSGKSTILEIAAPYIVGQDPGPTQIIMQSDQDAKDWAETRLHPLLLMCDPVRPLYPGDRHQKRKLEIIFPHMPLLIGGASMNNLQAKSMRWCLGDEVWLWKKGMIEEFRRRTHDRWNSRLILCSQGGTEGEDWHTTVKTARMMEYHWSCPCCSQKQPYRWPWVRFNEVRDENGHIDWASTNSTVRMVCSQCGHQVPDTAQNRRSLADKGEYIEIPNPDALPGRVAYHFPAMAVWWIPWAKLAAEFIMAKEDKKKGNNAPLRQFIQKRLAEFWKEEEAVPWGALQGSGYSKRDYLAGQPWDGELYRFMTVDKQRDHFWHVIRAWKADGSSRLISEGRLLTFDTIRSVQDQFKVKDDLLFVDAQYETHEVYTACAKWGWTALHGSKEDGFKHYTEKSQPGIKLPYSALEMARVGDESFARYMFWATNTVKDVLALLRSGRGPKWETPADVSEDYRKQIDSEVKKEVLNNKTEKQIVLRWVKIRPNHMWDCEAMQTAIALVMGILGTQSLPEVPPDPAS